MSKEKESQIAELLRTVLELPDDADVTSLSRENCDKWDSLAQVTLVAMLEDMFNIAFAIEDYGGMETYQGVVAAVAAKAK